MYSPSAVYGVLLPFMYRPVNALTASYNVLLQFCHSLWRPSVARPSKYSPMRSSTVHLACEVCCSMMREEIRCKSSSNISGGILMKLMKAASSSRRSSIISWSWSYRPNWGRRSIQGRVQQIWRRRLLCSFMYRYMARQLLSTSFCRTANLHSGSTSTGSSVCSWSVELMWAIEE